MPTNKSVTIRFAITDDSLSNEAIFKLSDFHGREADEARTERLTEWYKCWKAERVNEIGPRLDDFDSDELIQLLLIARRR